MHIVNRPLLTSPPRRGDHPRSARLSDWLLIASLCLCGTSCKDHATSKHGESASSSQSVDQRIRAAASVLNLRARDAEREVTETLQALAGEYKGQLRGLKHRLKTQSSTIRKLNKLYRARLDGAEKLKDEALVISDALRYTIEVADTPPGRYVEVIIATLKTLELKKHSVVKVKNYWLRGDNYSGVNTVLRAPSGLEWELQFHTPSSYQEASRSHGLYEQLRAEDTPLKTRQELFKKMSAPWEGVEIPQGVLEPKNLHSSEVIKQWSAPTE